MLTVSYADFDAATRPRGLRYRSKRLVAVLDALKIYQSAANPANLGKLRSAVVVWKTSDQKEFSRYDNGQLCSTLCKELAIYNFEAPKPDLVAYEITGKSRASVNLRPDTTFKRIGTSVADHLVDLKHRGLPVAVVLIDMQARGTEEELPTGTETSFVASTDDARMTGISTHYNGKSVLENQVDVLDAAKGADVPVFNVTTGGEETLDALSRKFPKPSLVTDFKKVSNNAMDTEGVKGKTLQQQIEAAMGKKQPIYLVVMGFDANQCIKGSVFGSLGLPSIKRAYKPGLLDLGYTVVTSRNVLASGNRPLESEYGPLLNM